MQYCQFSSYLCPACDDSWRCLFGEDQRDYRSTETGAGIIEDEEEAKIKKMCFRYWSNSDYCGQTLCLSICNCNRSIEWIYDTIANLNSISFFVFFCFYESPAELIVCLLLPGDLRFIWLCLNLSIKFQFHFCCQCGCQQTNIQLVQSAISSPLIIGDRLAVGNRRSSKIIRPKSIFIYLYYAYRCCPPLMA